MAATNLTGGAIAMIVDGGTKADGLVPVLQVLDIRPVISAQCTSERYRLMLSDGVTQQQAMLATQLNSIVKTGALQKGSVVRLTEYICSPIQNRKIIIMLNLEILSSEGDVTGAVNNYDSGSATLQSRASMSAQSLGVDQPGPTAGNPPTYGGLHSGGPVSGQSMVGGPSFPPKTDQVWDNPSHEGSYGRNMSKANMMHPVEQDNGSSCLNGGNQNQRFSSPAIGGGYGPPVTTYGRPGQPSYQQPPPLYTNRGPIAKNEAAPRVIPITALNPYQGRWTIKARVTAKTDLRRYNNPRGEGKVFSFDLLDAEGGEIRVTCFNLVADQFYEQIEVGKVYLISKGSLKPAQKNFNHLNNEYEIFLESTSTIIPCADEDSTIPRQQFNFKPINEIEGMENNSTLDLIGIVSAIYPAGTIMRKNNTETFKRTLQLKDMSGRSVELTLWGNFCNNEGQQLQALCESGLSPVLAVKTARVNEFSGKSVGTIGSSQLFIDPDFPEAHRLKEWHSREGKNMTALSISRDASSMGRTDMRKNVSQIKDEGLGRSEKPDWITVKATISFIKHDNFCYTACPLMLGDRKCSKKVSNNGDGTWQCDRCNQSSPECDYRYLLQMQIQDHTGMTWVTAFQESGEEIIGVSAKELYLLKYEEQDDGKFAEIVQKVLFNQFLLKLKIKEEMFSDEQRLKSTVVKAERVNPSSESRYLLGLIEKLSGNDLNTVPTMHGTSASGSGPSNADYGYTESKPFVQPVTNSFGSTSGTDGYRVPSGSHIGQHMNDYGGMTNHSSGAQLFCNNCNSAGHTLQNCPRTMNMPGQYGGGSLSNRSSNASMGGSTASNVCFKCQQSGHWARDCPGVNGSPSPYGRSSMSGSYGKQQFGGF